MTKVVFRNVSKNFGSVRALENLNLSIESGEFVSLLGPSGSGKSTTLNLLAGLLDCDSGEIRIGDRVVNDLPPDKRDIAMVFQSYALYPHMTVFDNLAFPLRARGRTMSAEALQNKVTSVASALGVGEMLARYPKELSGGQQQRVALGRAMVRDPKVFLLDEPLSNLDARLRVKMRHDLKLLHQRIASTIVYVTHDQAEAMSMSSRIAVFNKGRLQQFGTPSEIYNRPTNLFVGNFVGEREMTTLPGRIAVHDGAVTFQGRTLNFKLGPAAILSGVSPPGEVILGLRAESLHLAPENDAALRGRVTQSERVGPDVYVYARIDNDLEVCCRSETGEAFASGETVSFAINSAHVHLFNADTQDSIFH